MKNGRWYRTPNRSIFTIKRNDISIYWRSFCCRLFGPILGIHMATIYSKTKTYQKQTFTIPCLTIRMFLKQSVSTVVLWYELFTVGHRVSNRISPKRAYSQCRTQIVFVPYVFWLEVNWKATHLATCTQLYHKPQRQYIACDVSNKYKTCIYLGVANWLYSDKKEKPLSIRHGSTDYLV